MNRGGEREKNGRFFNLLHFRFAQRPTSAGSQVVSGVLAGWLAVCWSNVNKLRRSRGNNFRPRISRIPENW